MEEVRPGAIPQSSIAVDNSHGVHAICQTLFSSKTPLAVSGLKIFVVPVIQLQRRRSVRRRTTT